MLNPDGVIVGNYRCSLAGRDLNRNYKSQLKDSYPTIMSTKAMIKRFTGSLIFTRRYFVFARTDCGLNCFLIGCLWRGRLSCTAIYTGTAENKMSSFTAAKTRLAKQSASMKGCSLPCLARTVLKRFVLPPVVIPSSSPLCSPPSLPAVAMVTLSSIVFLLNELFDLKLQFIAYRPW